MIVQAVPPTVIASAAAAETGSSNLTVRPCSSKAWISSLSLPEPLGSSCPAGSGPTCGRLQSGKDGRAGRVPHPRSSAPH